MKKRIEYIDALRGFTMILVVFAHVETFMLEIEPNSTFISSLFISFRMPLFFFISGFIAYKKDVELNFACYSRNLAKKLRVQLIPTFFFGLLYTYLFSVGGFKDFITNYYKFGYWFTIALLGMFVILYTSNLLCFLFRKKRRCLFLILGMVILLAYIYRLFYETHPSIVLVSDIFCLHQICIYIPFFIVGYIVSGYREIFHRCLDNEIIQFSIVILFCITFYIKYTSPTSFYERNTALLIYRNIQDYIIGLSGICIIYNLFRVNSSKVSKETKLGRVLQYIGRRTLDIYMLHYFFLPRILLLGNYIYNKSDFVLELIIVGFFVVIVLLLCLFFSNILRINKYTSYYLLGVQNNKAYKYINQSKNA